MPVFTAKSSNLPFIGPILDIQIGPTRPALIAMQKVPGAQPPSLLTVSAMIDTGASCSVIKEGIPKQLGLHPVGFYLVNTPTSHNAKCFSYAVQLVLLANAGIQFPVTLSVVVIEAPLQGQNIQCLLGRDFLKHGIFIYSGPDESFSFSL